MCSTLIKKTYRFIAASLAAALCVILLAGQASAADGKTFRWSSAGDFLTFDVHAQNESLNSAANAAVYESLVEDAKRGELIEKNRGTGSGFHQHFTVV